MKLLKLAGASALGAVAIGLLAAPASYAGSLLAKETAVLVEQGVSPARASQALDVQHEVAQANLVSAVEAAMGGAWAGAWLEPGAAQIHFGVTSQAGRQAAQQVAAQAGLAAAVAYAPVRSTWSALLAAQEQWHSKLAVLLAGQQAMTGLDAQRNALSVTLSSSVPPAERAVLEGEAAAASVDVVVNVAAPSHFDIGPTAARCKFERENAYCEKTLVSGVAVSTNTEKPRCTAGPMLIEKNETYMLTAGHCFTANEETEDEGLIKAKTDSAYPETEALQKQIGSEADFVYSPARDMAIVKVIEGSSFRAAPPTPVPALLAEWGKKTESPQAVIGEAANVKGEANCHEGMTSDEQCGTIGMVSIEIAGMRHRWEHVVEDSACGEAGDSGGPFFFSNSKVNNVTMQGMIVAANKAKPCNEEGKTTYYEPLKDEGAKDFGILSTFKGKELLTTANETRKARGPFVNVKGDRLLAGETQSLEGSGKEYVLAAGTVKLKCTSQKLEKATLVGSSNANAGTSEETLAFEGCTIEGNGAGCAVEGGKVKAEPVKNTLAFTNKESKKGEKALILFQPLSGAAFAKVKFTGAECKLKETVLEGKVGAEAWEGKEKPVTVEENELESEKGFADFPETTIKTVFTEKEGTRTEVKASLSAFGKAATLVGKTEAKLTGGGVWGIFAR
jgi:Trypsin-like peptidase domain